MYMTDPIPYSVQVMNPQNSQYNPTVENKQNFAICVLADALDGMINESYTLAQMTDALNMVDGMDGKVDAANLSCALENIQDTVLKKPLPGQVENDPDGHFWAVRMYSNQLIDYPFASEIIDLKAFYDRKKL